MTRRFVIAIVVMVLAGAPALAQQTAEATGPDPALHDPSLATAAAPPSYKVLVETTRGEFVIEVHRDWAPNGADRFYNLVKIGFYTDVAFFRVIRDPDPFMAQVGIHGDPEVNKVWSAAAIPDDPIVKDNTRGMVTFAMRGAPDSRTAQFFVNFGDNTRLRQHGKFAAFGEVVEGMDVVDSLYSGYGEGAPSGNGPSQALIQRYGNTYLRKQFPKLDYIMKATVFEETRPEPEETVEEEG